MYKKNIYEYEIVYPQAVNCLLLKKKKKTVFNLKYGLIFLIRRVDENKGEKCERKEVGFWEYYSIFSNGFVVLCNLTNYRLAYWKLEY